MVTGMGSVWYWDVRSEGGRIDSRKDTKPQRSRRSRWIDRPTARRWEMSLPLGAATRKCTKEKVTCQRRVSSASGVAMVLGYEFGWVSKKDFEKIDRIGIRRRAVRSGNWLTQRHRDAKIRISCQGQDGGTGSLSQAQ